MAERQKERFRALEMENSTEDSEDTESESDSRSVSYEQLKDLPPLKESRFGQFLQSTRGNAMAISWNEVKNATEVSALHLTQDNHISGLPGNSTRREESKEQDVISRQDSMTVSNDGNTGGAVTHLQICSSHKLSVSSAVLKPSSRDGYNWRKYGQKQVKNPQGSRSYFRCTDSRCYAKKIEFSDDLGQLRETIYKSQHNHDPPKKVNSARQSRIVKTVAPTKQSKATKYPIQLLNESNPSTTSREAVLDMSMVPKGRTLDLTSFNEDAKTTPKGEDSLESGSKDRGRKKDLSYSSPVLQPGKNPKVVVHVAGDVGISNDGYRWRKYGQKMVKGKLHPRNYYRCTSAGCLVRKHIETADDNAGAVIITYKGTHDHNMPVPKKRHGLPSSPLLAATSTSSQCSSVCKKPAPTQWSANEEGDLTRDTLELGGENAMESAQTLLSIGIEIKPV
ncbi:hypothetical protein SAY86_018421 [Trapa natans]|uniref:WRKY domain-containing protein n=1 Tax=Trapa natans TaxID=22666 RepID=A0AAN7R345_TRANT|nr:hypothetical protein SAY86_018421 [Trapa natans]